MVEATAGQMFSLLDPYLCIINLVYEHFVYFLGCRSQCNSHFPAELAIASLHLYIHFMI